MSNHTTSREIKTAEPLWDDVWEQQIYHPCIHVLTLSQRSAVCTWRPHELLIHESSVSSLSYRAAVLAPFCCCSLKTLQDDCRGRRMLARLRGFTYYVVCFGCECQLNACEVKIQTQCSRQGRPERAEQTDESKLSKEQVFFYCYVLSASKSPGHCSAASCISSHVWLLFNHTAFTTCPLL